MRSIRFFFLLWIVVLSLAYRAKADDSAEIDKAVKAYEGKKFDEAIRILDAVIHMDGSNDCQ